MSNDISVCNCTGCILSRKCDKRLEDMRRCMVSARKPIAAGPLLEENRVIQGMWMGRPMSDLERLCIRSYIANGHEFHLYVDGNPGGVPEMEGLKVFDLSEILPPSKTKKKMISLYLYAQICDWFRWELMRQKGGWYSDMDIVCLRPCNFPEPVVFGAEEQGMCNSAMMKFPKGHHLASKLAASCALPRRREPWDDKELRRMKKERRWKFWKSPYSSMRWGEAGGPDGFTRAVRHFDMVHLAQSRIAFHPLPFIYKTIIGTQLHDKGLLQPLLESATTIHMWNGECWKAGVNFNAEHPENSLYEVLKKRYPTDSQAS